MARAGIAGLVLTPGASAGREQSGLVAIDEAVTHAGVTVERVEFPGQAAGKRRTDPPAVCIDTVRRATEELAEQLSVPSGRIAIGGRSFGGRMCSMAAAGGLDVAALVLVSYPLHPPGRPERLRTEHFPALTSPASSSRGGGTPSPLRTSSSAKPRGSGAGDSRPRRGRSLVAQERGRGRRRRRLLAGGDGLAPVATDVRLRARRRVRCGRWANRSRSAKRSRRVCRGVRRGTAPEWARRPRGHAPRRRWPVLHRRGRCRRGGRHAGWSLSTYFSVRDGKIVSLAVIFNQPSPY